MEFKEGCRGGEKEGRAVRMGNGRIWVKNAW